MGIGPTASRRGMVRIGAFGTSEKSGRSVAMMSESMTSHEVVDEESAGPRIADLVAVAASRRPDAPALVVTADRMPMVYRGLMRLVDDLPGGLRRGGLVCGDRVALRAASNAEFVVGLLAASRADLVVVPMDPALPVGEQRTRSEAAGVRVVLVDGEAPGDKGEPTLRWW